MSHASGEIWSPTGELRGYFEYNGTVDVACGRIYLTFDEMRAEWRKDNWRICTCGATPEAVVCYTDYGDGFFWPQFACFACMALIQDPDFFEREIDGHPFRGVGYRIGYVNAETTSLATSAASPPPPAV